MSHTFNDFGKYASEPEPGNHRHKVSARLKELTQQAYFETSPEEDPEVFAALELIKDHPLGIGFSAPIYYGNDATIAAELMPGIRCMYYQEPSLVIDKEFFTKTLTNTNERAAFLIRLATSPSSGGWPEHEPAIPNRSGVIYAMAFNAIQLNCAIPPVVQVLLFTASFLGLYALMQRNSSNAAISHDNFMQSALLESDLMASAIAGRDAAISSLKAELEVRGDNYAELFPMVFAPLPGIHARTQLIRDNEHPFAAALSMLADAKEDREPTARF